MAMLTNSANALPNQSRDRVTKFLLKCDRIASIAGYSFILDALSALNTI